MDFWGQKVFELHVAAAAIFRQRGFQAKLGKRTYRFDSSSLLAIQPAIVAYRAHSGKYTASTRVRFMHELPFPDPQDGEESKESWWPVVILALKDECQELLRGVQLPVGAPASAPGGGSGSSGSASSTARPLPDVVMIPAEDDDDEDDDENKQLQVFETDAGPGVIPEPGWMSTGGVCVLCCCQAQLCDDCPACWPVQLQHSRL